MLLVLLKMKFDCLIERDREDSWEALSHRVSTPRR